jgi:flagellin
LTVNQDRSLAGSDTIANAGWSNVTGSWGSNLAPDAGEWVTFANARIEDTLGLDMISVGVITQALENIAYLRAQNGGSASRLAFNSESLVQQKTNMRAALGRMVDVDFAEETTDMAKYSVLSQASASILAQANANTDLALMLLR